MRPWFRASGWSPNRFLLAGTVGSCSKDLGTLCWPLTSQSQKERLHEEWEGSGGQAGAVGGWRVPEVGGRCQSWLCPEWPWTNPLSPFLASFCPWQVLTWSLRPPPTSPTTALGPSSIMLDPASHCWGSQLPRAWGSLPHLFLEMRVILCKRSPVSCPPVGGAFGAEKGGSPAQLRFQAAPLSAAAGVI